MAKDPAASAAMPPRALSTGIILQGLLVFLWAGAAAFIAAKPLPATGARGALISSALVERAGTATAVTGDPISWSLPRAEIHPLDWPAYVASDALRQIFTPVLPDPSHDPGEISPRMTAVGLLAALAAWWFASRRITESPVLRCASVLLYLVIVRQHLSGDGIPWSTVLAPLIAAQVLHGTSPMKLVVVLILWMSFDPLAGAFAALAVVAAELGRAADEERSSPRTLVAVLGAIIVFGALRREWLVAIADEMARGSTLALEPLGMISPTVADGRVAAMLVGAVLAVSLFTRHLFPLVQVLLFGASLAAYLLARGAHALFEATALLMLLTLVDRHVRLTKGPVPQFLVALPLALGIAFTGFRVHPTAGSLADTAFDFAPQIAELPELGVGAPDSLRLFNDLRASEALVANRVRVFVDGRALSYSRASGLASRREGGVIPPSILEDYDTLIRIRPGWERVLHRWGFDAFLVRRESTLATVLRSSQEWREAAATRSVAIPDRGRRSWASWALFLRRGAGPQP